MLCFKLFRSDQIFSDRPSGTEGSTEGGRGTAASGIEDEHNEEQHKAGEGEGGEQEGEADADGASKSKWWHEQRRLSAEKRKLEADERAGKSEKLSEWERAQQARIDAYQESRRQHDHPAPDTHASAHASSL